MAACRPDLGSARKFWRSVLAFPAPPLQNIVSRSLAEHVPYKGVIVREFEVQRVQTMFDTTVLYP